MDLGKRLSACCDSSCRALLEKELETVGIRLNKNKPNIYFKVRHGKLVALWGELALREIPALSTLTAPLSSFQPKKGGGISFNSTVSLTQCSEKLVQLILHEYSILSQDPPGGCLGGHPQRPRPRILRGGVDEEVDELAWKLSPSCALPVWPEAA